MGFEISKFISNLKHTNHLSITVQEYVTTILNQNITKLPDMENDVVAIYNLGILFEPELDLNPSAILKNFSKNSALIIIWDGDIHLSNQLHYHIKQDKIFLDFKDTHLKILDYAI